MWKFVAGSFLRLSGWEPEGARPQERRFILIAAPHTSNWDLAYLLALTSVFELKISWMGKHQLFRGPMGWLMRRVGGIPIVRHERGNRVAQAAQMFKDARDLALAVPAEGTRSRAAYWKSGFYHIARMAQVPIIMGYLDYGRRRGGFGPVLHPSGNLERDMDQIRAFYRDKRAKFPEQFGEPRLKEEHEVSAHS